MNSMTTGMSIIIFCCVESPVVGVIFCWTIMRAVMAITSGWNPTWPMKGSAKGSVGPTRSGRERSVHQRNGTLRSSTAESSAE